MLNKRGMPPLIGTVLIIGFTVALAAIVMTWGGGFIRERTESTEAIVGKEITCSTDTRLDVKDAEVKGETVKLRIENAGVTDIDKVSVRIHGTDGTQNVQTTSGLESLEIQSFELSFDPNRVGAISKVEAFPTIKYQGEDVICSNCLDEKTVSLSEEGLVLDLPFDGDINDDSGLGNDCTNFGATFIEGKYGQALEFINGDYLDCGGDGSIKNIANEITIEAWAYPHATTTGTIASNDRDISPPDGGFHLLMTSTVRGSIWRDSTSTLFSVDGLTSITTYSWNHVAMTFNGTNVVVYLDGNQIGISSTISDTIGTAPYNLVIGTLAYSAGNWWKFNGRIDEVRIYNRTLSYSEIKSHASGNY